MNLDRPLFSLSKEGLNRLEAGAVYTRSLGEATKNGMMIRKIGIDLGSFFGSSGWD
jgi:hypothetical protein